MILNPNQIVQIRFVDASGNIPAGMIEWTPMKLAEFIVFAGNPDRNPDGWSFTGLHVKSVNWRKTENEMPQLRRLVVFDETNGLLHTGYLVEDSIFQDGRLFLGLDKVKHWFYAADLDQPPLNQAPSLAVAPVPTEEHNPDVPTGEAAWA